MTEAEWLLAEPYVRSSGLGRPSLHCKRELLHALFYHLRAGSAWYLLPPDLPPWRTVYKQFETWREDGSWDRLLHGLRQELRQLTRVPEPTAGAIDSQSVRTGGKRGAVTATTQASKWLAVSAILPLTRLTDCPTLLDALQKVRTLDAVTVGLAGGRSSVVMVVFGSLLCK